MMQVEEEDFPPLALDLDDDSPLGFGEIGQSMVANSDERRSSTLRRENNRGTAGEVSREQWKRVVDHKYCSIVNVTEFWSHVK